MNGRKSCQNPWYWGSGAHNEDRKISEHNTRNAAMNYDLVNRTNTFTSIQAAMPLSRAGHRFTHEVAPAGSGCPGLHPGQGSAGRAQDFSGLSSIISIM